MIMIFHRSLLPALEMPLISPFQNQLTNLMTDFQLTCLSGSLTLQRFSLVLMNTIKKLIC